jgi:hypothetical protein
MKRTLSFELFMVVKLFTDPTDDFSFFLQNAAFSVFMIQIQFLSEMLEPDPYIKNTDPATLNCEPRKVSLPAKKKEERVSRLQKRM